MISVETKEIPESALLCYKGVFEQLRGRRPILRLRLEAPQDEVLALAAQLLGHVGVHLVVADLKHGGLRRPELDEGRLARGHLDDGAAERPDVCGGAVPALALVDHLRGHVLRIKCIGMIDFTGKINKINFFSTFG